MNVFEAEPNKNWRLKSCEELELTYKTAKRTETDVQNFPKWAAILASLFAQANDQELAFQIWKSNSLPNTNFGLVAQAEELLKYKIRVFVYLNVNNSLMQCTKLFLGCSKDGDFNKLQLTRHFANQNRFDLP